MPTDIETLKELEKFLGIAKFPEVDKISETMFTVENCVSLDKSKNVLALNLFRRNLKNIPMHIFKFKHLKSLFLWDNSILEIPDALYELQQLEYLFLTKNKLRTFPSRLLSLPKIKLIDISRNKITELPREISNQPRNIEVYLSNSSESFLLGKRLEELTESTIEIFLEKNPFSIPPAEIVKQGIEAIRNYFTQIDQAKGQTQYLFEAKLQIIGDGGTGKTSFRHKLMNKDASLPNDNDTTLGIDVDKWRFPMQFAQHPELGDEVYFHVNIWDFGGQKIYRGTHQIFFSDKSYYVLVADTREQGTDFSYWLNTVKQLAGDDSAVLILLNKKHGHEIKFDERGYRGHFGKIIKDVFELDLRNDTNKISLLQDTVKLHLKQLPGIGDPLPPAWVQIRNDLVEEEGHFITFDRFREICAKHDVIDASVIRTLSSYFSRIGVYTHYIDDPILCERIYLNSNWLVNTVYEVLDNERVKEKKGRLNESDIKEIWRKQELDFEINRLAQLMHNFGLMYHIPNSKEYVVPEHYSG
jgi:internalin A